MNLTEPMNISAYQLLDLEVAHEIGHTLIQMEQLVLGSSKKQKKQKQKTQDKTLKQPLECILGGLAWKIRLGIAWVTQV